MSAQTVLGTVDSGITAEYQSVASLMPDDLPNAYDAATLKNTGDATLRIATLTADDAHSNKLVAGKPLYLAGARLDNTFVKTTNAAVDNILEFTGTSE